jgi:hypothetical protein
MIFVWFDLMILKNVLTLNLFFDDDIVFPAKSIDFLRSLDLSSTFISGECELAGD